MELDLGSIVKAKVKVGADVYEMSVPTVKQSITFNKQMKDVGEDDLKRTELFIEFLSQLGMPAQKVESLSVQQLTALTEGLMGSPEKK